MKHIQLLTALACSILLATMPSACKHEPIQSVVSNPPDLTGTPCSLDTVYFQNQIQPLLTSQCGMADCHNTQFHTVSIDVTNYAGVRALVSPGSADGSVLYNVITTTEPADRMPIFPLPPWNAGQVSLLRKWINQGALNNGCNEGYGACDTTGITYANFIQPLMANQCAGCHIQNDWGGGVLLNTYDDVKSIVQKGRLLGALTWETGYYPMPKFGKKWVDCDVRKVEAWIKGGMKP